MRQAVPIRRLEPGDDRNDFTCGNIDLDRFFQRFAGLNQFRHHIGVTYVAVEARAIVGFVTVSPSELDVAQLTESKRKRLPKYPLPVLRLARLAVRTDRQGRGIGLQLLRAALTLAQQMSKDLGCAGVVVDAKPDALSFYEKYGFEQLEVVAGQLGDRPQPIPMFLPISSIPT